MITYKEFVVINTLLKGKEAISDIPGYVYNNVHYYAFKSQEEVGVLIAGLEAKGYIQNGTVTPLGMREIEPLKVHNAVILAAG